MSEKLEGEGLVSCLRQLIVNCEPFLREAGSLDQAEDALLHLEENDENFHKYEFVKALRNRLDEELGNLIDEEIELHAMGRKDAGYEELVEQISEKVIASREFSQVTKQLKANTTRALEQLLANFVQEFCSRRSTDNTNRHPMAQRSLSFSDGDSSFSSSFNQASLMFISQEKLMELAEHTDRKLPLHERREAMYTLCQIPNIDVQNGDSWPIVRRAVLESLGDADDGLANFALRFIARGFSSSPPNSREMYITLVEHLENQFSGKRTNIPKIRSGLELQRPDVARLMMGFRLMNEFQHQIPQYWVRYSEKFLEDILDRTLSLLSFHYKLPPEDGRLTPVHFIAVLDPRSVWFIKWMHGNYSRTPMTRLLQKYKPLITEAVKACLRFIEVAMSKSVRKSEDEPPADASGAKFSYTAAQLDYLYFVHSFCLLTRLLCYERGRAFFPLMVKEKEPPVSITKLICVFVSYVINTRRKRPNKKHHLEPGSLITDALKQIASTEGVCEVCLCNDDVVSLLLSPLQHLLKSRTSKADKSFIDGQEFIYLQIVDIISNFAATKTGRQFLLYGNNAKSGQQTAAHIVAQFVQRSLRGQLRVPSSVVVAFIYVCRQFYCTGEGLQQLRNYSLHQAIAQAWRESLKDGGGRAEGDSGAASLRSAKESFTSYILWEETLLDNLLNFAGTVRGLLCLQQTGALRKCVKYMFSRYIKKLQVSKYEKFGYGMMLTQVAGTACGMAALMDTGFIRTLVHDVWAAIEFSADDRPVFQPRLWPVDVVDRAAHKPFINILNVLSAQSAIAQLLAGQQLPNKESYSVREIPNTFVELLDRIIVINSPAKMNSLFYFYQSHVFGLRMLSVLTSNLDTFLLLQTQFHFQEVLLQNQRASVHEDHKKVILDAVVVERNFILVKTFLVGGPNERSLPKRCLSEKPNAPPYDYPIVFEYPVPKQFLTASPGKSAMKQDNPLSSFLNDTRKDEVNRSWIEGCQRAFFNGIKKNSSDQLRNNVYCELLERMSGALSVMKERTTFPHDKNGAYPEAAVRAVKLNDVEELGIDLAIRYGESLKFLGQTSARSQLENVHKTVQLMLKQQQKPATDSEIAYTQGDCRGHDWFVSSVFLLFGGNADRCLKCLQRLFVHWESAYMWPHRMYHSNVLNPSICNSGIPPYFYKVCHAVECILALECPLVASAFRMSGFTAAQMCQHWLGQCFWNYLDWPSIAQYLCLPFVLGADHQVYFCLALLKHMQKDILYNQQCQNLLIFLKEESIKGFYLRQHIGFMQTLEEKYRDTILPDLMDVNGI